MTRTSTMQRRTPVASVHARTTTKKRRLVVATFTIVAIRDQLLPDAPVGGKVDKGVTSAMGTIRHLTRGYVSAEAEIKAIRPAI